MRFEHCGNRPAPPTAHKPESRFRRLARRVVLRAVWIRLKTSVYQAGRFETGGLYGCPVHKIVPLESAIHHLKVSATHFRQVFQHLYSASVWFWDWLSGLGNLIRGRDAFLRLESGLLREACSCSQVDSRPEGLSTAEKVDEFQNRQKVTGTATGTILR